MSYPLFIGLPGGAEWVLCMGMAAVPLFLIFLMVFIARRPHGPTAHAPARCPSCGRGNLADARFCAYCGRTLTPGSPPE